jgi:hypothetical protein
VESLRLSFPLEIKMVMDSRIFSGPTIWGLAAALGSSDLFALNSIPVMQRVEFPYATADLP